MAADWLTRYSARRQHDRKDGRSGMMPVRVQDLDFSLYPAGAGLTRLMAAPGADILYGELKIPGFPLRNPTCRTWRRRCPAITMQPYSNAYWATTAPASRNCAPAACSCPARPEQRRRQQSPSHYQQQRRST